MSRALISEISTMPRVRVSESLSMPSSGKMRSMVVYITSESIPDADTGDMPGSWRHGGVILFGAMTCSNNTKSMRRVARRHDDPFLQRRRGIPRQGHCCLTSVPIVRFDGCCLQNACLVGSRISSGGTNTNMDKSYGTGGVGVHGHGDTSVSDSDGDERWRARGAHFT